MYKKMLSVFLATLLVLSSVTAGLVAFAADAAADKAEKAVSVLSDAASDGADEADENTPAAQLESEYSYLLKNEDKLTKEQKSKLNEITAKIGEFGEGLVSGLTSEETQEAVAEILDSISEISINKFYSGNTGSVAAFEEQTLAYSGTLNTKEPSEQDVADYNALLEAYRKLTSEQKEKIDITVFSCFMHLIFVREAQLAKNDGQSASNANKTAQKKLEEFLGEDGHGKEIVPAKELGAALENSKLSADEKLAAFAGASEHARVLAGAYNKSSNALSNSIYNSSNAGKSFVNVVKAYETEGLKANPFTEKAPTKVSKPNASKYELGEQDPEYIKAFALYIDYTKAAAEYNARKANHTSNIDNVAIEKIAAAAPEYKTLVDYIKSMANAYDEFNATKNTQLAKSVIGQFDSLSIYFQSYVLKNTTLKYRTDSVENTSNTEWKALGLTASELYAQCQAASEYEKVTEFIDLVNGIEQPYNNKHIALVKEKYEALSSKQVSLVPNSVLQKYKDILASVTPDIPSTAQPDLTVFAKTSVQYPLGTTHDQVEKAVPKIQSFLTDSILPVLGVEGGLKQTVQNGVYTNATVVKLCQLLFPLLAGLSDGDGFPAIAKNFVKILPTKLATELQKTKDLDNNKYEKAVAALNSAETTGKENYDKYLANGGSASAKAEYEYYWSAFEASNGLFGFDDGDREGFIDAVSAVFRALSIATLLIDFENVSSKTTGTYTYNAYEDLVPIFEILDLRGVMSSPEYTEYVNEQKSINSALAMDARIKPILIPICNLLDDFADNPLNTVLDISPKLGYGLKSGILETQLWTLLGKVGMIDVSGLNLHLTPEGIYNLVAPLLSNLTIGEGDSAVTLNITLNKADFLKFVDDIGGCAAAVSKDSKARGTAFRLGLDSDRADSFVVTFRYLYGVLTEDNNMDSIKSVVDSSSLSSVAKLAVKGILGMLSKTSADTAISMLINLVEPNIPKLSDILPGLKPNEKENQPEDNSNSSSQESNKTDNGKTVTASPSVPKTGGKITAALSLIALSAGAAGAYYSLAKKKNR